MSLRKAVASPAIEAGQAREKRPSALAVATRQRISFRLVEPLHFLSPEAGLVHLKDRSPKHGWRHVLDRKAQGFRDRIEPSVPEVTGSLYGLAGIETGARIVINHGIAAWPPG